MSKRQKEAEASSSEEEEVKKEEEEESDSDEDSDKKKKKKPPAKKKAPPKKKTKRDPNAPKPAMTAYVFYSKEKREEFKNNNPGINFGDLSKKVASAWKNLTDEEKAPYSEMAKKDKNRYAEEMKHYKPASYSSSSSEDDSDDKKKKKKKAPKKKKAKKDPNAPKPATNAYMFFQKEKREEIKRLNPQMRSVTDIAKKMGEIWRGMSEDDKAVYVQQANKDKDRYKKDMEDYKHQQKEKEEEEESEENESEEE